MNVYDRNSVLGALGELTAWRELPDKEVDAIIKRIKVFVSRTCTHNPHTGEVSCP